MKTKNLTFSIYSTSSLSRWIKLFIWDSKIISLGIALCAIFFLPSLIQVLPFGKDLGWASCSAQNVGINTTGATPNAKALLDIDATGLNPKTGLLIPRMTTTERNAITGTIPESLLIYNTDTKCFEAYNATTSTWVGFGCIGCTLPAAPTTGTHTPSATQIVWNWNTVSGATGYKYNTANNYGTATDNLTSTSYTQTLLTCNTAYSLYVWAYNTCGNSTATTLNQTTSACCTGTLQWTQINDPSVGDDVASAVTLDATGLYVAGRDNTPGNLQWRIEKRNLSTGVIIWTQTSNPSATGDAAYAIAVDATGIYVGGQDNALGVGNAQWRIEKRDLSTGATIIWTQTFNPSAGDDAIYAIAVDATGVYVAGHDYIPGNWEWRIEKRNLTTGALIWSQTEDFAVGMDIVQGIAVDATGIYVTGTMRDATMNIGWQVEKRDLSTGAIIWSQQINLAGEETTYAIATDATGVYITGYDCSVSCQIRIEKRDLSNGNLLWVQYSDPSVGYDIGYGIAVDGTGIYLGGRDNTPGNPEWRIESRSLSGSLNWGVSNNPSAGWEFATGVAIDASGFYIVGWDAIGGNQWHIEKRCK